MEAMLEKTISFPGLGIGEIDPPRALNLFGFSIYLYGIIIAVGFLLAFWYCFKRVRQFGLTSDNLTDAILFGVPLAIIGARLYYVAFQWKDYAYNPIKILFIRDGGLAIYGGVIGALLGLLLLRAVKKTKITPYLDITGLGLLIGQCVGRWGNFFNRECYGEQIKNDFFLRMGLSDDGVKTLYYHPTFLYESVWNLIGFVLLHFLSKKRKFDGEIFLMYVAWYGLGRVWIEGLRTDSLYIPGTGIRVSQLLAGVSFVLAAGLLLYIRLVRKPDGTELYVNKTKYEAALLEAVELAAEDEASATEE